ncbi:adenylate/guanylate cyclase domain-containing protein [Methylobacterium sp. WSM2598]|uniref:adenylate/guanylate cyclase domain-containing protein n=1 Tax=Methylobacterium sp. WSM2598 TaxID=398261 RepID=UPI0009FD98DA|nr:adenylate/guanylate cyclase domain-containing protein [Methylobacterium sp. WSM2598]
MAKPSLHLVYSVEPHVAAVLAADMVGYTQHMCRDEAGTLALLRSLRRDLLYPSTKQHGGRVIKSSGDGVLVEFPSTYHAVCCAIELQRAVHSLNENTEEPRRVFFRMGICVGDITVEQDGDIYGNAVNLASRLEGIAPSGGICLSRAALDQVHDKIICDPVDWGLVRLKNVDRAVQVFVITPEFIARQAETKILNLTVSGRRGSLKLAFSRVALLLVTGVTFLSSDQPTPSSGIMRSDEQDAISVASIGDKTGRMRREITSRMSVVILPFKNPDGGSKEDSLAEAIAADITSDLTRIDGIFIVSSSIALRYQNRPVDPQEIGKELDVRYVFSGTMHHADGRFRINAQLVDASTGAQIWADRFKSREGSWADIEDEIVDRLVRTLTSGINDAETRRIREESSGSGSAIP